MLGACKKEEEKPVTASSEVVVEDNNRGMAESDAVLAVSEGDMTASDSKMGKISAEEEFSYINAHGATVSITPKGTNTTGMLIIDFGSTGIKSPVDGRTRKGKIQIVYTDRYRVTGSTQTITLDNYYVDGSKLEGTKVLTHSNENNVLITSIKETGGKIIFTDGKTIEWNSERTRKWNTNNTFFDFTDDEVMVAGRATGKSREGVNFTMLIENNQPLLWKASCFTSSNYVAVSGILKITPSIGPEYTVDYGDGSCNKEVTVNAGGASKTITLTK
jgi:hypothetical protein